MSFLDTLLSPFNTSAQTNAANVGGQYLTQAQQQSLPYYNTGLSQLQQNYTQGILPFTQAYGQAQPGIQALQGALGLSGPIGTSAALQQLQSTPGYQFQLQAGNDAIKAQNAATGGTGSGNEAVALAKYGQGLAGTTYNNYVGQLSQFPQEALSAAQGAGNLYAGEGNQTNAAQTNIGNMMYGNLASRGNLAMQPYLAQPAAGSNILGLLTGLLGGAAGSSGASSGVNSLVSGGKALGTGLMGLFGLTGSDKRIKDDIEEIGKLNDGQRVYRFRYKGDSRPQIGLMAQEVEKHHPEAVAEIGGVKFVHYGKATNRAAELQAFMS